MRIGKGGAGIGGCTVICTLIWRYLRLKTAHLTKKGIKGLKETNKMSEVRIIGWEIRIQSGQYSAKVQLNDGRYGALIRKRGYFEVIDSINKSYQHLIYVSYGHPDLELARKIIQERDSLKLRKNNCLNSPKRREFSS